MALIAFLNVNFIVCVSIYGVRDPILSLCVTVVKTMSKGPPPLQVLL
jgi:hypothetical protein